MHGGTWKGSDMPRGLSFFCIAKFRSGYIKTLRGDRAAAKRKLPLSRPAAGIGREMKGTKMK